MTQGAPLVSGIADVPTFDQVALIKALRTDQAGESTFPEFLAASWLAESGFCDSPPVRIAMLPTERNPPHPAMHRYNLTDPEN